MNMLNESEEDKALREQIFREARGLRSAVVEEMDGDESLALDKVCYMVIQGRYQREEG